MAVWRQRYETRLQTYKQCQQQRVALPPSALGAVGPADEESMQLGRWIHEVLALRSQWPELTLERALQRADTSDPVLYARALDLLNKFYASDTWRQITNMKQVGAELPFSLNTSQGVVSGVIDLLLQDKNGDFWVIDYKTDQVIVGQEKQVAQKYAPQLAVYVLAAQKLYPSAQVRAAVVFIRNGVWVELNS